MKQEFTELQKATEIVHHLAKRIVSEGLENILQFFRQQGLDEDAITAVLNENSIVNTVNPFLSDYELDKIASDLLAAEQDQFHNGEMAETYRQVVEPAIRAISYEYA